MTTAPPPQTFQPPRRDVSAPTVGVNTRRASATVSVEESLKTYQLLEALRTNDTGFLQNHLASYQPPSSSPNNSSSTLSGTPPSLSLNHTPSPLILAVQCSATPTVEYVLSHLPPGFDINQRDQYGNTALHYAAKSGRLDVVDLLLKQKNINDTLLNNEGKQAVDMAKTLEVAESLKVNRDQFLEHITVLYRKHVAASDLEALRNFFQDPRAAALIDINHQDCGTGATLLHDAARKKDIEMVKFCLDHGADINIRDRKGKLPIEVTREDKIKNLLKEVTPTSSLVITTLPNQSPKLKGYLHKWTNYAGGYKTRWFVLENGILSYFKNQDDAGNSCRGSINMRIATISRDSTDRQRFDIIGKGSVRYHLRANHFSEAEKWIKALQQSMQWKGSRRTSLQDESSVSMTVSNDDDHRIPRIMRRADTISSMNRERSRSPSNDSIEVDTVPHADTYQLKISSARAQMEMLSQLLESVITTLQPLLSPDSRQQVVVDTFKKSLGPLQHLVDDVVRMSEDRDTYWQRKLEKELEAKRLWEESMRGFAIEQAQMEEIIQENVKEHKMLKKLSKLYNVDVHSNHNRVSSASSNSPAEPKPEFTERTIVSPTPTDNTELANLSPMIDGVPMIPQIAIEETKTRKKHSSTTSLTTDLYDSDDEFFDAMDGSNNVEVEEAVMEQPSMESDETGKLQPYVAPAYSGYPDHVRTRLPLDQKSLRPDVSLWSILKNSIGKDLSKITLPVYFNEPTSMLQRMAEDMEYSELLDIAARQKESTERILYVAAFAMSNYSSTVGRVAKPFNPLLGETYEYVRPDKAFRYISEQVSHHPPISACYCESPNYDFFAEVDVKSKFWGKSFEILPKGVSHVNLKVPNEYWPNNKERDPNSYIAMGMPNAFSEHYSWKKVTTCVNNLIVGSPWIDHYGDMVIINHITGDKCVLTFKARGWRGKDAFEIRGIVYDANGKEVWEIAGRWNERLVARRSGGAHYASASEKDLGSDAAAASATELEEAISSTLLSPTTSNPSHRRTILLLWKRAPLPEEPIPFNLTPFAITLNDLPESLKTWIAPTDSRLRPDQRALETGQYDLANSEKVRLEEKQRTKRRARERGDTDDFKPRWFIRDTEPDTGEGYWRFNHEYWQERERTGKEKSEGTGPGKWNVEDDDIF
ncbi:3317_t:CDS:2 [Ambispora leptoticha]|uniref:3317_t:CDS:1 n=1 Tax=Ambispora leptoticha TaxID=144679 RepID=A0A9N9A6G2_9GLOM|nr:3317_t:CDS:2 [Ambispora leptoticha]